MLARAPVVVEVTRGPLVESRHLGAAAVVKAGGELVQAWGDIGAPVYARSAIKPLQAIPLVESGAADRFGLADEHVSLACASHSGEPRHVAVVRGWLQRIGLSESDLECGAHLPGRLPAHAAFLTSGDTLTAAYNNCSGKHSGFLTTAVHLGDPTKGYIRPDHPVQKRINAVYAELGGFDAAAAPVGTDGCGIPTLGVPLREMATAMAALADPARLGSRRGDAVLHIRKAMVAEPFMMAGTGRFCTRINGELGGRVLIKTGAEGVYCGFVPELGLGIALKMWDGAGRAAEVAMAAILHDLGMLDAGAYRDAISPPILNVVGLHVGDVRPAREWMAAP